MDIQRTLDNILSVLHKNHQVAADVVEPHLQRLLMALADGHTFVYVKKSELADLRNATPIVGYDENSPLILKENRLFLAKFWHLEKQLAGEIQRLSYVRRLPENVDLIRENLRDHFRQPESQQQQAATALTLLQNFMLLSGGPGTGKTTTVAKLLALLCNENAVLPKIGLVAPTGKAAARMSEALKNALNKMSGLPENVAVHLRQLQGQTVHRLLSLKPPQMLPEYDSENPLPLDILVVDEASMLDIYLLLQLLQALPTHCRVILLGDENQLPSVSAGAVLAELMKEHKNGLSPDLKRILQKMLPEIDDEILGERTARLTVSHRFGQDSAIGCLARAVAVGDGETAWAQFARFSQDLQHNQNDMPKLATQLYRAHEKYWQAVAENNIQKIFQHQNDVVVLTAQRTDAEKINQLYLNVLQKKQHIDLSQIWFAGQIIMITRNDVATNLFNGDVGIVLPNENNQLMAYFSNGYGDFRAVALSRLPEHENAFAMTVHKSQGSEYENVWFVAPNQEDGEYSRALIYTAITRAKARFAYFGDEASFQAACAQIGERRSALSEFLNEKQGKLFD